MRTTVEIPQLQIVGEIVRDTQTSDSLGTTPDCQVAQTGLVEVVEIETSSSYRICIR